MESGTGASRHKRLRDIPAVNDLLSLPAVRELEERAGHAIVREAVRSVLDAHRVRVSAGEESDLGQETLEAEVQAKVESELNPSLRRVINATGVVLHTNLGRAPLARQAVESVAEVAARYSNLEYDLEAGERGQRDAHTDRLLAKLVGAEAVLVVNNNAAAVFVALNTLADGGEVLVSRGELIEIGGSFRIPEICAKSGALLREVGTTNRTRLSDYAAAIGDRTRVLLRVHPSNFRIVGFTERPDLAALVELAHRHSLAVIEDLGSGCLVDLAPFGLQDEPPAGASLRSGVDVATFSGDKLLGGPQAGILAGRTESLARIRKNPLFRALRVDKLTIAALEATARLYLRGDLEAIPVLRILRAQASDVAAAAARLKGHLSKISNFAVELEPGESVAGGGSSPGHGLPTTLVTVVHSRASAEEVAAGLRQHRPPVIARVERGRVLLDPRTLLGEDEEHEIAQALERIGAGLA
jgi:L-seryl-tRNA(Ser) seleniumtransferase